MSEDIHSHMGGSDVVSLCCSMLVVSTGARAFGRIGIAGAFSVFNYRGIVCYWVDRAHYPEHCTFSVWYSFVYKMMTMRFMYLIGPS